MNDKEVDDTGMRVIFVSDLHGRTDLYHKMLAYALQSGARCVVIGGDLLPTRLDHLWKLLHHTVDFSPALHTQLEFIDKFLAPLFTDFTARHPGVSLLYIPGNHDWHRAVEHLKTAVPAAVCLHGRTETINGVAFTGYGCTNDSPFWVKDFVRRDLHESGYVRSRHPMVSTDTGVSPSRKGAYALQRPSMEEELSSLSGDKGAGDICVFHCPPFDCGLDTLYTGRPIGSKAIARFIVEHGPLVSLHGHIHEAPYMSGFYHCTVGTTLAVNPGHHPGRLHAVAFDTDNPLQSLTHRIFGTGPVSRGGFAGAIDRRARLVKGFFMKKVLAK
jgi:Icc-related predicted phosphoesterase